MEKFPSLENVNEHFNCFKNCIIKIKEKKNDREREKNDRGREKEKQLE